MNTKKFLNTHPVCCFCGGNKKAETIEHLPAKIIYPKKHRPKGMEYPACKTCNALTKGDDSLLALISRITGSLQNKQIVLNDPAFDRAVSGLLKNFHGFKLNQIGNLRDTKTGALFVGINSNHPQIHTSLCRLAAKFALAKYYEETKNIADQFFRINTLWTHNQSKNFQVEELLKKFQVSKSLQQGKWTSDEIFYIRSRIENNSLIIVAVFYESLALIAHLNRWEKMRYETPFMKIWAPLAEVGLQEVKIN